VPSRGEPRAPRLAPLVPRVPRAHRLARGGDPDARRGGGGHVSDEASTMTPELSTLVRGAMLGFSIAAPVGPIGVLCIRRTLAEGRLQGLATGLGAAAADGVYGAIAALGLTWLMAALVGQQFWIRLGGGAFLLWL